MRLDAGFVGSAAFPVGVFVREACCREVLPLAVEYLLKVEGELERVDTGLPRLEASLIRLVSLGSREVGEAGEVGDIGVSTSCLVAPYSERLKVNLVPERSLRTREWWAFGILDTL